MLTKTNIKAIKMADAFIFQLEGESNHIRCVKKGQQHDDEPFAQPDVHHDIACDCDVVGQPGSSLSFSAESDAVIETVLYGLKEADQLRLEWHSIDNSSGHYLLALSVQRKDKTLRYLLTVADNQTAVRQAA